MKSLSRNVHGLLDFVLEILQLRLCIIRADFRFVLARFLIFCYRALLYGIQDGAESEGHQDADDRFVHVSPNLVI
jgi:hypothetical protein